MKDLDKQRIKQKIMDLLLSECNSRHEMSRIMYELCVHPNAEDYESFNEGFKGLLTQFSEYNAIVISRAEASEIINCWMPEYFDFFRLKISSNHNQEDLINSNLYERKMEEAVKAVLGSSDESLSMALEVTPQIVIGEPCPVFKEVSKYGVLLSALADDDLFDATNIGEYKTFPIGFNSKGKKLAYIENLKSITYKRHAFDITDEHVNYAADFHADLFLIEPELEEVSLAELFERSFSKIEPYMDEIKCLAEQLGDYIAAYNQIVSRDISLTGVCSAALFELYDPNLSSKTVRDSL